MTSHKLLLKLREKLSPKSFSIIEGNQIVYYDFHGVTFQDTDEKRQIVQDYIVGVAEDRLGFPIEITDWSISNNGHFAHSFVRKKSNN